MEDKVFHILNDDLRNNLIHVGDCKVAELKDSDKFNQLFTLINSVSENQQTAKSEHAEKITNLKETVLEMKGWQEEQRRDIRDIWAKVHDGYEDRISSLEYLAKLQDEKFVTRKEFNGFAASMREQYCQLNKNIKWIGGLGFTALSVLIALMQFL